MAKKEAIDGIDQGAETDLVEDVDELFDGLDALND